LQIAEEMKPNPVVASVLTALSRVAPSWRVVPGPDIIDIAFKVPKVREEVFHNIFFFFLQNLYIYTQVKVDTSCIAD